VNTNNFTRIYLDPSHPYSCRELEIFEDVAVHWHNFFEFDFFMEGNASHILNSQRYSIRKGTLVISSDTDYHGYALTHSREKLRVYTAHFANNLLPPDMTQRLLHLSGRQFICRSEEDIRVLQHEFEVLSHSILDSASEEDALTLAQNVFTRIILLVDTFLFHDTNVPLDREEVRPEIAYIDRYFRHPITLEEVAEAVGLSPCYFSRKFHQDHGVTFQTYLLEKRLRWARDLIADSSQSITQIAEEAGFNSRSYFFRRFKAFFGLSPGDVRQHRGDE